MLQENSYLFQELCGSIEINGTNGPRFHLKCRLSLLAYHFNQGLGRFKINLEGKIPDLFWRGFNFKNCEALGSVPKPATKVRVSEVRRLMR